VFFNKVIDKIVKQINYPALNLTPQLLMLPVSLLLITVVDTHFFLSDVTLFVSREFQHLDNRAFGLVSQNLSGYSDAHCYTNQQTLLPILCHPMI
jgi:hypothetical protein